MKQEDQRLLPGRTLVVGIGEVGGALAEVLDRTEPVLRHDLERRDFADPVSVMHICIPFKNSADFERIALSYIERFKPGLTIINSTVIPGTTRSVASACGLPVAFSPIRGKHARMTHELIQYVKFVAAPDRSIANLAESHFSRVGFTARTMDNVESLELAKLAETTYFGLLIAFAQELNRYAAKIGGNYEEAIGFFEEVEFLPRRRYFPGFIGGHCVVANIGLLEQVAPSLLLDAIVESNRRRAVELNMSYKDSDL
jgi:UDP-N-acetyl-D-mannosaminuronate dehydrogenase